MNEIWIVDDDQSIRWVLEKALSREGFPVRAFGNSRDCLSALERHTPRVLVSDIRMPGGSGLDLLEKLKQRRPDVPVIIMTAYSDLDSAVSAFQGGAFDYLPKPFDLGNAVDLIRRAWQESEHDVAAEDLTPTDIDMIGQAPAMQEVFRAIGRLSQSNVTVLITGESGTGKELIARALHKHSPRAKAAFVALNTAAIPRDLLESELFGHERGAFTGAQQSRPGRFEQAEGGTLFLDEIGDMPAELQTRLLRILSDGEYYRVGGRESLRANVRVIAATHQSLEARVREGLFREDLFHRLNVIRLRLPPLRERRADVPLLIRHFLQTSARELGGDPKRLTAEAMEKIAAFDWPGNVRQLENTARWLTVMVPAQVVDVGDLPPEIRDRALVDRPHPDDALRVTGASSTLAGGVPGASMTSVVASAPMAGAESIVPAASAVLINSASPRASEASTAESRLQGVPHASGMPTWIHLLEREVARRLTEDARDASQGADIHSALMDQLSRDFESAVIGTALRHTRGRRVDAALRLGIGRNTITRKIQELHLEDRDDE